MEIIINKETFLLSREAYNQIIKNAEIQIDKFIERSGKLLRELLRMENGEAFARAMIYKWDEK